MAEPASFRFAVLRYLLDSRRGTSVPVGVVVWSESEAAPRLRLLKSDERVPELARSDFKFFLSDAAQRIDEWIAEGRIPFSEGDLQPNTDEWWLHARRLLRHRVRLTEPRPIDCVDPEEETNLLFDAVVRPVRQARREKSMLARLIRQSLGGTLDDRFDKQARTPGYQKHDATVLRLYQAATSRVVLEAVNLAADPAKNAYQLVGKAGWIQDDRDDPATFLIGYTASPNGLNGERIYKEWIEKRLETRCFDLIRDREEFRQETERLLGATGTSTLPLDNAVTPD